MYINPFLAGVLATILIEALGLLLFSVIIAKKHNR